MERSILRTKRPMRLCLFGAAGDTGNLGVSALKDSVLGAIARFAPDTKVTVFDNGWGVRPAEARFEGGPFAYERCGARMSRRYHRRESYANMRVSSFFGGLGNPGVRAVREADAIWDISGGDSFGDVYGERTLRMISEPKRMALREARPLVLLPQTYGPFRTPKGRALARRILSASRLAWARDQHSFEALKTLLEADFDPERHRAGVDVAFALEAREPARPLPELAASWLRERDRPVVGINVSGLIYNDPAAAERFGLSAEYRELLRALAERFLRETEARVLFVSHVLPTQVLAESDLDAARDLSAALDGAFSGRWALLPAGLDQSETKWVLGQLDWFCGTRMHATIGSMSSRVPTAGLAYSLKMQGVFETCGQGARVADLRRLDTAAALDEVWHSWEEREASRAILEREVPAVHDRSLAQLLETLEVTAESVGRV